MDSYLPYASSSIPNAEDRIHASHLLGRYNVSDDHPCRSKQCWWWQSLIGSWAPWEDQCPQPCSSWSHQFGQWIRWHNRWSCCCNPIKKVLDSWHCHWWCKQALTKMLISGFLPSLGSRMVSRLSLKVSVHKRTGNSVTLMLLSSWTLAMPLHEYRPAMAVGSIAP